MMNLHKKMFLFSIQSWSSTAGVKHVNIVHILDFDGPREIDKHGRMKTRTMDWMRENEINKKKKTCGSLSYV